MSTSSILFGVTDGYSKILLGDLPREAQKRGWEVHIVSGGEPSFADIDASIRQHVIPMSRMPSLSSDFEAFFSWIRVIRQVRPEVVSLGTPKAAFLGLIAAAVLRVPTRIYLLRGLRMELSRGPRRLVLWVTELICAAMSTRVIAVSQSLATLYVNLRLCNPDKIVVPHLGSSHGVDAKHFRPGESGEKNRVLERLLSSSQHGIPVVGFVGRLHQSKGLETLVRLREHLCNMGVDHEFLVVGRREVNGIDENSFALHKGKKVWLIGELRDVRSAYRVMDVLVLPTLREGFPNVVLEANASGLPVVTTTATGAIDSLVHGVTGLCVPTDNRMLFLLAVEALLADKPRMELMGENARKWVLEHFVSKAHNRVMLDLHLHPKN